jgi:hypothetical protein
MPPAGCEGLAGTNAAEVLNTMHDRVDSDLVYTRMQVFLYLNNNSNILAVQLVGRAAKCLRPEKAEMLQSKVWRKPPVGLPYVTVDSAANAVFLTYTASCLTFACTVTVDSRLFARGCV